MSSVKNGVTMLAKRQELGGWNSKKYKIESTLNHGSYGTVYAARNSRTHEKFAIKQVAREQHTVNNQNELAVLTRCRKAASRNIIKLIDSFSDETSHYIVLEYCTLGDLYEIIAADKVPTDTDTLRDLILQLISAVEASHSVGVYHRDIKPENIFLSIEEGKVTKNGDGIVVVKLGDFGLATWEDMSTDIGTGSDRYMAPEQFSGDATGGYSPAACDIWSLGIVILNILYSRNPWKVPSEQDEIFAAYRRNALTLFDHFSDLTSDTFNVLRHALAIDPAKRSLKHMRTAIMNVTHWSKYDQPSALDSRTSTNLAEYEHAGPTAGRAPLRTPSVAEAKPSTHKKQQPSLHAFQWRSALSDMAENTEDHRNGLGFARPEQQRTSGLSWRIASPSDLDGFDSGLGTSLASSGVMFRRTDRQRIRPEGSRAAKTIPSSAPARRIHFPPPAQDKQHLKFGTSWADLDDQSDEENFGSDEDTPSNSAPSASSVIAEEEDDEIGSVAESALFEFEEGDHRPRATVRP